jgi:hypothetical protein
MFGEDSTENPEPIKSTGGAGHSQEQGQIGGERNTSSLTNNYDAVHEETNKTFFNPNATTEQVITNAPAFLYGFVGKVGTGTLTIRDDSAANAAATDFPVYTLAVGTHVDFPAVRMENGITAQCSVGTNEVTFFWRAI